MGLYDEFCGVKEGTGRMFPGKWRGGDTQLTLDRAKRLETKDLNVQRCLLKIRSAVVILDEMDDVNNGEHAREARVIAVPEGSRDDAIEEKTLESLLDGELRVEDDEPEGDGEGVVAGVATEKAADGGDGKVMQVMCWIERL